MWAMKAVGVKELKARLSEYLRLVKGGETILVTERNDVVAELRPTRRALAAPGELEDVLDALASEGEIIRASAPKPRGAWHARGLGLPAGTATAVLDELREER
jgi:antitoxin (DNA-binding transcriptional repressor) of toxin-antitoxin stability system